MSPYASEQQTILVIDDSEIVLEMTRKALEAAGYRVITRDKPAGCVALLLYEKPALVLLDVNMPAIAGDTIANMFGKAQPNSDTVVLLHSSLPSDILHARAAAAGAHGYIQKTSDQFELVRQVNRWLRMSRTAAGSSSRWRVASEVSASGEDSSRPSSGMRIEPGSASEDRLLAERGFSRRPSGSVRSDAPVVLFVDDDLSVLSTYRKFVQSQDVVGEFALSGAQALRRIISSSELDAVVCDVALGDMNGVEVYRSAVARDKKWKDRFVFSTGSESAEAGAELLKHFKGHMLYKPISNERLRDTLRAVTSRKALRSSGSLG